MLDYFQVYNILKVVTYLGSLAGSVDGTWDSWSQVHDFMAHAEPELTNK